MQQICTWRCEQKSSAHDCVHISRAQHICVYNMFSAQDIGTGQCVQNSVAEHSKGQIYICETQLCQQGIFGMNVDTKQPVGVYTRVCLNNYKWEYII